MLLLILMFNTTDVRQSLNRYYSLYLSTCKFDCQRPPPFFFGGGQPFVKNLLLWPPHFTLVRSYVWLLLFFFYFFFFAFQVTFHHANLFSGGQPFCKNLLLWPPQYFTPSDAPDTTHSLHNITQFLMYQFEISILCLIKKCVCWGCSSGWKQAPLNKHSSAKILEFVTQKDVWFW